MGDIILHDQFQEIPAIMLPDPAQEPAEQEPNPHFIESNTQAVSLEHLENDCIIPTFKDYSPVIAPQQVARAIYAAATYVFSNEQMGPIEFRVSHAIHGRIPSAIYKKASELLDSDKTLYYQRICAAFEITSKSEVINGEEAHLCIGFMKSLHETNLYSRKSAEPITIFCSYRVRVCSNQMLSVQFGLTNKLEVMDENAIYTAAINLFSTFAKNEVYELQSLRDLGTTSISTTQFSHIIGKMRLYQALSTAQKKELDLPDILLGDSQLNATARGFVNNPNFSGYDNGGCTLWSFYNLLTESAKSSYIDAWPERNANCLEIAKGLQSAIRGESDRYLWFLS